MIAKWCVSVRSDWRSPAMIGRKCYYYCRPGRFYQWLGCWESIAVLGWSSWRPLFFLLCSICSQISILQRVVIDGNAITALVRWRSPLPGMHGYAKTADRPFDNAKSWRCIVWSAVVVRSEWKNEMRAGANYKLDRWRQSIYHENISDLLYTLLCAWPTKC